MKAENLTALQASLVNDGYCIIQDCLPAETLAALNQDIDQTFRETPFGIGDFYGYNTKRFGSLVKRSRYCADLVLEPLVLRLVENVLGSSCERIQLNVAQAISVHPGEIAQFPHRDDDMWPCTKNEREFLVNVIWPLSQFSADNGATRIYPGSDRQVIENLTQLGRPAIAECSPGDAIVFLGSTIHGAGANVSDEERRAVVVGYSLGWLKPYENNWLAYPPQVARTFSPELAALVGYAQHRPNLGNYEGQCPSILLGDRVPAHIHAIDSLRPDQAQAVREFAAIQRGR